MGVAANVGIDKFPRQGRWLGKPVRVCFHYDPSRTIAGLCVRDDAEEPGVMILRLEDGRHVLSAECMYTDA